VNEAHFTPNIPERIAHGTSFLDWSFCLLEGNRVLKHCHVQKMLQSVKHCINIKTWESEAVAEQRDQKKVRHNGELQNQWKTATRKETHKEKQRNRQKDQ